MRYETARELVRVDPGSLSLEKLQHHKVRLIDAWRESRAEYGMKQAIRDGFYLPVLCDQATGFAPRDIFLTLNLDAALQRTIKREAELLKGDQVE